MSFDTEGPRPPQTETQPSPQQGRFQEFKDAVRNWILRRRRKDVIPHQHQEQPRTPEPPRPRERQKSEKDKTNAREKELLSELGTDTFRILPGEEWSLNYPDGADIKKEALERLFEGTAEPADEVNHVTPDALIYDQKHIHAQGYDAVRNRIHDTVTTHEHFDYNKLTTFVRDMHGTSMDAAQAEKLYNTIAFDRTKHIMDQTYDMDDRNRIRSLIQQEADGIPATLHDFSTMEKMLKLAGLHSFTEKRMIHPSLTNRAEKVLFPSQLAVYQQLQDIYNRYITTGDQQSFNQVVEIIKNFHDGQQDQDVDEREFDDPPDAQDEYNPPEEKNPNSSKFYEIEPHGESTKPYLGYYAERKQSTFNPTTKSWSTPLQHTAYTSSVQGTTRQKISGRYNDKVVNLPIPSGFVLDVASLRVPYGPLPKLTRDQNGCFHIEGTQSGEFSIDFLPEEPPFNRPPESADRDPVKLQPFGAEIELLLQNLQGSDIEKAHAIQKFIQENHQYPKDLDAAAALQHKFRGGATDSEHYFKLLEESPELECFSANSLQVAMLRKLGIASRIVLGHHLSEEVQNKAIIDGSTGHAWAEVWDGNTWVIVDATPAQVAQSEQGEDGEGTLNFMPSQTAKEGEQQQGEQNLQNAKEAVEDAKYQQAQMNEAINGAESFNHLEKLQEAIRNDPDLFNDMKAELEKKIKSIEEQKQGELREEIDQMMDQGFIDDQAHTDLHNFMDHASMEELDAFKKRLMQENAAYQEFNTIKDEVEPLVDEWYDYFLERLPVVEVIDIDTDDIGRRGAINKGSLSRVGNQLFGRVFNPRIIRPEIRPKYLASIVVDVSLSMDDKSSSEDERSKLENAKRLVVFYNELFSRINKDHGYLRFSIYSFSNNLNLIKRFDQDYDAPERYEYPDGDQSTVKARLMNKMKVDYGTNMLQVLQGASSDLTNEVYDYPDYASSLIYVGDGEDTHKNEGKIRSFLQNADTENGFGDHALHAIMLGTEKEKSTLSNIFGEEHTSVAPDLPTLIQQSMEKFEIDMEDYFQGKI